MASAISPIRDTPETTESERYRLVIFEHTGTQLLLCDSDGKFSLPEIVVPKFTRVVEKITSAVQANWGLAASLLKLDWSPSEPGHHVYAALEAPRDSSLMRGLTRCSLGDAVSLLTEASDVRFIESAHASAVDRSRSVDAAPFSRLGWKYNIEDWVWQVSGLKPVTSFQLSGSEDTSLIRFETPTRPLWLKAVGQSDPQEFTNTVALARWFPNFLPRVVAFNPFWNAWLMESGGETNLRHHLDPITWAMAARRLAELQIGSICYSAEFLASGCIDLQLNTLMSLVTQFFEFMGSLMEKQITSSPAPLTIEALSETASVTRDVITELSEMEIPNVIGHSDFNPGNVLVNADNCVFIDWSAAHVSNPLLTIEYLVAHFKKNCPAYAGQDSCLINAFITPWQTIYPQLERALKFAPLLGVFASAVANKSWQTPTLLERPGTAGYLRSLARIMKREAYLLTNRGTLA